MSNKSTIHLQKFSEGRIAITLCFFQIEPKQSNPLRSKEKEGYQKKLSKKELTKVGRVNIVVNARLRAEAIYTAPNLEKRIV